jgi:hypothetical protein
MSRKRMYDVQGMHRVEGARTLVDANLSQAFRCGWALLGLTLTYRYNVFISDQRVIFVNISNLNFLRMSILYPCPYTS